MQILLPLYSYAINLAAILLFWGLSFNNLLNAQVPNKTLELEDYECVYAIRKIAFDLFADEEDPDQVKSLKMFLREANMDQLSDFVENAEMDESDEKIFAIENYPFIYYAWLGAWYECVKKDERKIYRYYTVALEYVKDHPIIEKEADLLKEFKKAMEGHPIEGLKQVLEQSQ
jgi:hypothetical protein